MSRIIMKSQIFACLMLFVLFHTAQTEIFFKLPPPSLNLRPSPPGDILVVMNSSRAATVLWTPSVSKTTVMYTLEVFKAVNGEDDPSWKRIVITYKTWAILHRLEPETEYAVYITATNQYGISPKVKRIFETPPPAEDNFPKLLPEIPISVTSTRNFLSPTSPSTSFTIPERSPTVKIPEVEYELPKITVKTITNSSISLVISNLPKNRSFFLYYNNLNEEYKLYRFLLYTSRSTSMEHELRNLSPSTVYNIWIQIGEDGPTSIPIRIKTLGEAISEYELPEIIVNTITDKTISLEISQSPSFQKGVDYQLFFNILNEENKKYFTLLPTSHATSSIEHVLRALSPSTTYVIWIEIVGDEVIRTIPIHVKTSLEEKPEDDFNCDKTCRECVTCSIIDPLMRDPENVNKLKTAFEAVQRDLKNEIPKSDVPTESEEEEEDIMFKR